MTTEPDIRPCMTPREFKNALGALGLSPSEACRVLGIRKRLVQRVEAGDREVPGSAAKLLQLILMGRLSVQEVRDLG